MSIPFNLGIAGEMANHGRARSRDSVLTKKLRLREEQSRSSGRKTGNDSAWVQETRLEPCAIMSMSPRSRPMSSSSLSDNW